MEVLIRAGNPHTLWACVIFFQLASSTINTPYSYPNHHISKSSSPTMTIININKLMKKTFSSNIYETDDAIPLEGISSHADSPFSEPIHGENWGPMNWGRSESKEGVVEGNVMPVLHPHAARSSLLLEKVTWKAHSHSREHALNQIGREQSKPGNQKEYFFL